MGRAVFASWLMANEDIRAARGGHVARYGKGALRRRPPVVRQDTAPPAPTPAQGSPAMSMPPLPDKDRR
jgi:hypothetical protein